MQYIFDVFPRRIFGEASFILETSFFDHEKIPWHAWRMPRATPKPWRTLAPSRRSNLQPMMEKIIMPGTNVVRCNQYKMGFVDDTRISIFYLIK
jgi:hypothetical protein